MRTVHPMNLEPVEINIGYSFRGLLYDLKIFKGRVLGYDELVEMFLGFS